MTCSVIGPPLKSLPPSGGMTIASGSDDCVMSLLAFLERVLIVRDEVVDKPVELLGVLNLGPVAAAVEQDEVGVRNGGEQAQAVLERDHAVVAAVNQHRWHVHVC